MCNLRILQQTLWGREPSPVCSRCKAGCAGGSADKSTALVFELASDVVDPAEELAGLRILEHRVRREDH